MITNGGWIDRGYAAMRYREIAAIARVDPDANESLKAELAAELESPAEIDNPPEIIKVENQKCSNCGHEGEYERFCWNCPVIIIKGRGNWVPKDELEEQNGQVKE